jgi:putative redox protein
MILFVLEYALILFVQAQWDPAGRSSSRRKNKKQDMKQKTMTVSNTSTCRPPLLLYTIITMWTCVAATKYITGRYGTRVPGFLARNTHRKTFLQQPTSRRFASSSSEQGDAPRKSYHIQGTSTSPAEQSENIKPTRRRRGCGPSVTVHTVNMHHTLQTDLPKTMGGDNLAPQPVETLLAAWIGCTQATALFVGRQMMGSVQIDKMNFDIMAFRDERGALQLPIEITPEVPSRLLEIKGTIQLYTPSMLSEELLEILKEQTEARCPVANMLIQSGCEMNVNWVAKTSSGEEGSVL